MTNAVPFDGTPSAIPTITRPSGDVWNPVQWRQAWQSKVDANGGFLTAANIIGGSFSGNFTGTLNLTGALSATGGITFEGGTGGLGSIYTDSNWGALIRGRSGAVADVALQNSAGTVGFKLLSDGFTEADTGILIANGANQAYTGTVSAPFTEFLGDITGTITADNACMAFIGNNADTADASGASQGYSVLWLNEQYGGAGFKGSRSGLYVNQAQTGAITDPQASIGGIATNTFASYNMGGTGTGVGASGGVIYGGVLKVDATGNATNLYGVIGTEIDFAIDGSATSGKKVGLQIVQLTNDTTAGALQDVFLLMGSQRPTGSTDTLPNVTMGIQFGGYDGQWSWGTGSTLIGTQAQTVGNDGGAPTKAMDADYGIDFSAATFSRGFLKSAGFLVDGSGYTSPRLVNAGSDSAAASAGVPIGAMYRNGNSVQVRLT